MSSLLNSVEATLYGPRPWAARLAVAGFLVGGAVLAALLVALAGPLYAVAGSAALLLGCWMLGSLRGGYAALFAVIGLLPFAALPFKLGFTPTFLDLAVLALYLVWIMRLATRRDSGLFGAGLGVPVLVFLLLAIFAFANGLRYNLPTMATVRNFVELLMGIGLFFLLGNHLRTRSDLDYLVRLALLAGAAAAAIAVAFYVMPVAWTVRILNALSRFNYPGGEGALRYINDDTTQAMRAIGTQIDPNVLGGFMVLAAVLTAPQLVSSRPLFPRAWLALFVGVETLALYFTHSRGSMAGLAAGLLLLGLIRYRRLVVLVAVGAILILVLPPTQAYVAHFVEGLQLQDQATLMRLGEYKDALALIQRYPWFGVGFTGSPTADLYVGVSSLYFLMAEEMGLVGLSWFLMVVALFLAQIRRAWRHNARESRDAGLEAMLLGAGGAIAAGMVGGLLDHYLFNLVYPHMTVVFWAYLSIGVCAAALVPALPPELPVTARASRVAAVGHTPAQRGSGVHTAA